MTEHWSLLASRSLGYTESMSRASIFIAALSGSVIALALVGQATDFGDGFVAFALVLLPVVFFLGASTFAGSTKQLRRLGLGQGMNRIRNAYLELAPGLEPYFVTSVTTIPTACCSAHWRRGDRCPCAAVFLDPGRRRRGRLGGGGRDRRDRRLGLDLGTGWSLALGGSLSPSRSPPSSSGRSTRSRDTARLVVRFPGRGADQPTS